MQHETNFPQFPTDGAYFGNPLLKAEADARLAEPPPSCFLRNAYYQVTSVLKYSMLPNMRHTRIKACPKAHLALTGNREADIAFMKAIQNDEDQETFIKVATVLETRYNIPMAFTKVFVGVYDEAVAGCNPIAIRKDVAQAIYSAIQPGTSLVIAVYRFEKMPEDQRRPPHLRYLDLIDILEVLAPVQSLQVADPSLQRLLMPA